MPAIWSCRSVEYVPVESVKYDTTYINKLQRDSIYQFDSVYIYDKGDTLLITKTKYIYRDKLVHDTTYISKTDSIQVPYPVEKKLSKWQQFKVDFAGYIFLFCIFAIVMLLIAYFKFR